MQNYRHTSWIDRLPIANERITDVIAVLIIGLGSGAGVMLFKAAYRWLNKLLFTDLGGWLHQWGHWTLVLIPVLGGIVIGLMHHFLIAEERHHGVSGIMEAVALAGGRLRYWRAPLKILASVVSLGAGASVGPEDPSVQIGASLGSLVGQKLRMSDERTRMMVAMGAASGIAAAFNAPIAGVFFAIEIILGELTSAAFGLVVFGAVLSAVVTRAISGQNPAFQVPSYALRSPLELPLYIGLGFLAALVAVAYIRAIYWSQDWFHNSHLPVWLRPALTGAIVGAIGLFFPQIFGDGYGAIGDILFGRNLILWVLVALLTLKIIATSINLGSGFMGGLFAPSLFLGAALGGAYGVVLRQFLPSLNIQPSAFALVGMAAVLAGAVHAPVTAIMLLFEMTDDYRIILPLMFAVAISVFISQSLQSASVYEVSLLRKGIRLQRGRDVDVLQTLRVSEVMKEIPETVRLDTPLREASTLFTRHHVHGLPVVDGRGNLCGVIAVTDIERALEQDATNIDKPLRNFCMRELIVAHPDETVQSALRRMGQNDIGRLPVVDSVNPRKLVGWLSRVDIVRAYDLALARRSEVRHQVAQVRLGAISGLDVFEIDVESGSVLDGKLLSEVKWPEESLVASVRRGRRVTIPHGETRLQADDQVTVIAKPEDEAQIKALLNRQYELEQPGLKETKPSSKASQKTDQKAKA
jgi:CIC family chloride channel protein